MAAIYYYVDPASGANSNSGTSTSAPWKNPPGTRTATDSAFYSASWGAITTSNKVRCGDVILLKGGSTQTSAQGGAWWIDPTYYTNTCTSGSRITIRVASNAEWSGSTGSFTLDGTGITPSSPPLGTSDHKALIQVAAVNYLQVLGLSDAQRFVVTNSTDHDLTNYYGSGLGPSVGFRGDWWLFTNSAAAFNIGNVNNWQVSNSTAHNISAAGPWQTGFNADIHTDAGGFVNVTAYDSGCGSVANPGCTTTSGKTDLFFFVGSHGLWCVNCTAYGGGERGVNTGVISNTGMGGDYIFKFRNLISHDNGATCSGGGPHYCSGAGFDVSGNDWLSADVSRNYLVGAVLFHNANVGFHAYGGAYTESWNVVTYNTNYNRNDESSYSLDTTSRDQRMFNSIDVKTGNGQAFGTSNSSGSEPQKQYTPTVLNSCFRPMSANSEGLGAWPGSGTYAAPPAWIGATNKTGLTNCDPKFVALNATTYLSNDFHLQTGSTAIDAGRFLMLANGAGSNATTINVKANGGSSDPRNYFIGPSSYLDAAPDTIQILGCGQVTITSMTATSISFTPACSWADGAGVHLPWAGSGPDMGAFEFGLGFPVPPAPTLLSVQPMP